jgi:peroxiredoxin
MSESPTLGLPVGAEAPDFTLRDQFGHDTSLAEFRGRKAVALVFYPFAFSGVCTGELGAIRHRLDELITFDTEVLAISCDPIYALRTFADTDGLNFGLLSDFWPHGAVSSAYGVLDERSGCPRRSTYVIDKVGRIAWSVHNPNGVARDLDELIAQLDRAAADT